MKEIVYRYGACITNDKDVLMDYAIQDGYVRTAEKWVDEEFCASEIMEEVTIIADTPKGMNDLRAMVASMAEAYEENKKDEFAQFLKSMCEKIEVETNEEG